MESHYFKYNELLSPPIKRAAYSDRTAWLMAVMSQLAYLLFEKNQDSLKKALSEADFELVKPFDCNGTQAFLAKRECDKMAILAFRGTQKEDPQDIVTDLKVIQNYNEFLRLAGLWTHRKESVKHHAIDAYCEKLAQWALKRLNMK